MSLVSVIEVLEQLLDMSEATDKEMLQMMYMLRDSMSNLQVEVKVVQDWSAPEVELKIG